MQNKHDATLEHYKPLIFTKIKNSWQVSIKYCVDSTNLLAVYLQLLKFNQTKIICNFDTKHNNIVEIANLRNHVGISAISRVSDNSIPSPPLFSFPSSSKRSYELFFLLPSEKLLQLFTLLERVMVPSAPKILAYRRRSIYLWENLSCDMSVLPFIGWFSIIKLFGSKGLVRKATEEKPNSFLLRVSFMLMVASCSKCSFWS